MEREFSARCYVYRITGAVSWSGVNLGFAVSSVISSGSKGTQQAGAQGGSAVMSLVKNIGTKSSLKK